MSPTIRVCAATTVEGVAPLVEAVSRGAAGGSVLPKIARVTPLFVSESV
jgi:hypothetical protein